jgi:branched-chain amino acid transport system ATP-binding protein
VGEQSFLELRGVRSGYGSQEILHGVDLDVEEREFICLLGPNGAGKSTLVRTIFGMCNIVAGSIRLGRQELRGLTPREVLAHGVVYVPQGRCNFPLMTVEENLEMSGYIRRDGDVRRDQMRVYELFPMLAQRRRQPAVTLSGGEQQMLEMGMALLRQPRLLLVDEPSLGLAPQAITTVFNEIQRIHDAGTTILLVEQNTRKALQVAGRAVVLRLGQIIWNGAVAELTDKKLGALFLTGMT